MPETTSVEVRVRYAETDQMGVAYHSHYLVWCELARTEHMRRVGLRYRDLEDSGYKLAVAEASLRYARSARYDDLLGIACWVHDVASRRIIFKYRVERPEDGALLCTAETALISLDKDNRTTRIPDFALKLMRSVVTSPE